MLPTISLLLILCSIPSTISTDYLHLPLYHSTTPKPTHPLSTSPITSGASSGAGQYYTQLLLGSPPQPLRLVADTGSDLTWARCSFSPHPSHSPLSFRPLLSSSFSPLRCRHSACRLVPHSPCAPRSACHFRYSYSDRSSSSGVLSRDRCVLTASPLTFGCAVSASLPAAFSGVLGLGRGPLSLPSQLRRLHPRLPDRFSYCLADYTLSPPPTTYLILGNLSSAAAHPPSRRRLRFTPLLSNPLSPTYYYVRVISVSVSGKTLPVPRSAWSLDYRTGTGGIVIDSGTTLSFLPAPAYKQVVDAVARRLPRSAAVVDGPPGFGLCFNSTGRVRVPRVRFALLGGAVLAPPARNYLVEVAEGVRCLAFRPVARGALGFGVIGNLMQQGFLFVFDREKNRLGFARTGCGF